jgi:hypothetical protein
VTGELLLRDVIDIPESVHAGDFKVELSGGFTHTEQRVAEYVVTDQLLAAFGKALSIVRAAVRDGSAHAAAPAPRPCAWPPPTSDTRPPVDRTPTSSAPLPLP